MNKKLIRLTESDLHKIVKESVKRILKEDIEDKIYSEKEMQWLYDNQDSLSPIEEKILNIAMWDRARRANYHGYDKRWPNIKVENGKIFYPDNGMWKEAPR